jgi:hypothetical protein
VKEEKVGSSRKQKNPSDKSDFTKTQLIEKNGK